MAYGMRSNAPKSAQMLSMWFMFMPVRISQINFLKNN